MDFENKTLEEVKAFAASQREALNAIFTAVGDDVPSDEQDAEMDSLAASIEAADTEATSREAALTAKAEKLAARKAQFAAGDTEEETPDEDAEVETEEVPAEEADEDTQDAEVETPEVETEEVETPEAPEEAPTVTAKSTAKSLSRKIDRPETAPKRSNLVITASSDVPEFSTGQKMDGLTQLAQAALNRSRGFPTFNEGLATRVREQTGQEMALHKFGLANMSIEYPAELTIKRGSEDYTVFETARDESRLPGGSLVKSRELLTKNGTRAAGGWCAPSETVYDLCEGETLEGLLSIAEIGIQRGGVNHTNGPTFGDVFDDGDFGFLQTEADAIAGETKDCMTIVCPEFREVRLDAIGYCVKIPLLTEVGYPELIRRFLSLAQVAYQRKRNKETITRILAKSVTKNVAGIGAIVTDTLEGLEILADQTREKYALSLNHSMEVVVPFWVKGAYKSDLARRNGMLNGNTVSDADVNAHFAAHNLNVQYVYDYQAVTQQTAYPATYQAIMYPAGQFVRGNADVINLSNVYDAASLSVNTYTGIFFEQGLLLLDGCWDSFKVNLPICTAGQTGATALTCEAS